MNQIFKRSAPFLALLGLVLGGCQPDLKDDPKPGAGQANFGRYIAVGNSLTAGYSDGGLYLEGQLNSFPSILAQQFAKVGGGSFVQPLFPTANAAGSGYLKIAGFNAAGPVITSEDGSFTAPSTTVLGTATNTPAPGRAFVSPPAPLLVRYTAADNQNLGVPGIRIADINTADYGRFNPMTSNAGNFNPFFERLLSGTAATTYQQYVQERVATLQPTFFTNWLGSNDVLGFATTGGTGAPLTPVATFTTSYNQMVDVLTANNAKGLLATIPNVTDVPLFTTVPVAAVIAGIKANPMIPNAATASLYIRTGAGTVREATAADLLLLPARAVIGTPQAGSPLPVGVGYSAAQSNPLPSQFVLDDAEKQAVVARTTELNNVIKAAATRKNLALFDANAYFVNVARTGVVTNVVSNTAAFVSGNLFSLDGVHPTPRGYAVLANEMIKVINDKYGASVPGVDATKYRGVKFP